ncbi:MAG TPA: hypothetical protein VE287_00940, partial [Actinopolymorphaceae bacterium]|nr:hypothetical protein [Actinopolymorphaceae bacterium]
QGGTHYFRPDARLYEGLDLAPVYVGGDADPFQVLRLATAGHGLSLNAWTIYLHSSRLGSMRPDLTERNVFGDPCLTDLCPANPTVRAYAQALTLDVARLGCDAIFAESLHYHPLAHGYHHERYLFDLDPLAAFFLGLCFCSHCEGAARRDGVDVDAVARHARDQIEAAFAGRPRHPDPPLGAAGIDRSRLDRLLDGEVSAYLGVRCRTVATLASDVAEAATPSRFYFLDGAGAFKGYATGEPQGEPSADAGFQIGVAPDAIAGSSVGYQMLGYVRDPDRLRLDVTSYAERLGGPPRVVLRPTMPDCPTPDNLATKLALLGELGVSDVDFYHYGLVPLANVEMAATAMRST